MATRFEIVLHGPNPVSLRAAAEQALDEIDRLENQLSLYRGGSEIAHVNARAAYEPVKVTPPVFALLEQARVLNQQTGGAFDITIGPLVRAWGFMGGTGRMPEPQEVEAARARTGMHFVELRAEDYTVRFRKEGLIIDLGAIGKGYAIDCVVELLREAGITSGIVHGGTSTVYGIGKPPDADTWRVAIEHPSHEAGAMPLEQVALCDQALSVSAVWGRSFETEGKSFGHVIDPRTGQPTKAARLAAVVLPSATESDALSTALLTLGRAGEALIKELRPGMKAWVA
jgi:thiamine biosynthesis lipoprotein